MKKPILITLGVLILLLIIGVWVYLFIFGAPKSADEIFARFGSGGVEDTGASVERHDSTVDVGNTSTGAPVRLRQLTTRPVAGAMFQGENILYVEQGTGFLFSINLATGEETRIENALVPQASDAVFSKDGAYVAITAFTADGPKTMVSSIPKNGEEQKNYALPIGATEISFGNASGTIRYLLKEQGGATGQLYTIAKETSTQLFAIPIRDVHVLWGDPIYVYTTPSGEQIGNLYKIVKDELTYVTHGGAGLVAFRYQDGVVASSISGGSRDVTAISAKGESTPQALFYIPEKCVQSQSSTEDVYCATPTNIEQGTFPDDWYKGVITYNDILWRMNTTSGSSEFLIDPLEESGRQIDVLKIGASDTEKYLSLINKNDNTLWLFDTTIAPPNSTQEPTTE